MRHRPRRQPHAYITTCLTIIAAVLLAFRLVEASYIWIVVGGSVVTLALLILEELLDFRR